MTGNFVLDQNSHDLIKKKTQCIKTHLKFFSKRKMTGQYVLTVSRSNQIFLPFSWYNFGFKTVVTINMKSWEGFYQVKRNVSVYPHLDHIKYVLMGNLVVHRSCMKGRITTAQLILYSRRSLLDFGLVVCSFTPNFHLRGKDYLSQTPKKWFILSL